MTKLTHFDGAGAAHMVDVAAKPESARRAVATGAVEMQRATFDAIAAGTVGKGDVLGIARVAAIAGLKRTSELIPLCHPVRVTAVEITFTLCGERTPPRVEIAASVGAFDRTGVEMEALTAVGVAALTLYDMCKAADRGMRIVEISLLAKEGGKSGSWSRQ